MKHLFSLLTVALLFSLCAPKAHADVLTSEQEKRLALYGIAFYNLENLFDTIHDAGKNDYEFLPTGSYKWNGHKYRSKLKNMARVLSELCTQVGKSRNPAGAAVIGISEIENRHVVEDLLQQDALRERGYQIAHIDGPDRRGVECGFLYNPRLFHHQQTMLVPYYYLSDKQPEVDLGFYVDEQGKVRAYDNFLRGDTTHITRGFLVMSGTMAGEKMHFIVCHWPSRAAASPARERAGYQVRHLKEALQRQDPGCHIIIMGDMNDDPNNPSMNSPECLGCKHTKEETGEDDLYNPWWDTLYKVGQGSLLYNGKWNLFDQIVFTGNLLGTDRSSLKFLRHDIFLRDYLMQQEGRYKGGPLRTTAGGTWLNGYSDHLPTQIYLVKELQ